MRLVGPSAPATKRGRPDCAATSSAAAVPDSAASCCASLRAARRCLRLWRGARRRGIELDRAAQGALGGAWSRGEQAGAAAADAGAQAALAEINREYEARFGHIYIVCASGKSAEELLQIAGARLGNTPEVELRVAGEELRQSMQLRLAKLVARTSGESGR